MIWFNIKELENKISNNELSDKDGFNYVLAFFILSTIGYSISSDNTNGWFKLATCVISVLINIWGLRTIYNVNNEMDGKDFFKRFFAINWVIGFRLFIITIIVSIIFGIIVGILSVKSNTNYLEPNPIKDLFIMIFISMFSVICYLLIINSFRRLKLKTE